MTTAIAIIIATACVAIALIVAAVIIAGKQMETEQGTQQTKMPHGGVVKPKPVRNELEWVFPLQRSKVIFWVPVEERLPENMSRVLVTICAMVGKGELVTTTDVYSPLSGKWRTYNGDVIAWAKLPEPYKK